tara:strand:- start:1570 stop:2028 length:459 start_codon:yes stop_codon:yes gene_type:complete
MLIKLVDGAPEGHPLTDNNFFRLFPNTSFGLPLTPEDIEPFGYGLFEFSEQPEPGVHKKVVEKPAVKNAESGVWIQQWGIEDQTDDEKAEADAFRASVIRLERNAKLEQCDYTQLSDSPVDAALWLEYRKALRDISQQSGFPWNIDWPEKPA